MTQSKIKPKVIRENDEAKKEYRFTLVVPHSFAQRVKNWKFSICLEFMSMLAEPDDFID